MVDRETVHSCLIVGDLEISFDEQSRKGNEQETTPFGKRRLQSDRERRIFDGFVQSYQKTDRRSGNT